MSKVLQPTIKNGFVLFYGSYLSNFYPSKFIIDGVEYWCGEQWMMAEKARVFEDNEMLEKILAEKSSPWKIKLEYGRKVKNFDVDKWAAVARQRVYVGLFEKFRQNPALQEALLATGDNIIVECSPTDKIWGIGMSETDPRCVDKSQWQGKNWLGQVLMEVRKTLKEKYEM